MLVMDNRAQEMHIVVIGGSPQPSSSSLAGIVFAPSIRTAVAARCCCSISSGTSACCSPRTSFPVSDVKAHGDGQQATRGGLLRCIGPYGGRALDLGCWS